MSKRPYTTCGNYTKYYTETKFSRTVKCKFEPPVQLYESPEEIRCYVYWESEFVSARDREFRIMNGNCTNKVKNSSCDGANNVTCPFNNVTWHIPCNVGYNYPSIYRDYNNTCLGLSPCNITVNATYMMNNISARCDVLVTNVTEKIYYNVSECVQLLDYWCHPCHKGTYGNLKTEGCFPCPPGKISSLLPGTVIKLMNANSSNAICHSEDKNVM